MASTDTDRQTSDKPKGIMFVSAYVDDFSRGYSFYAETLGLTKLYDMGEQACFFSLGPDLGLYLQGGCEAVKADPKHTHASFTLAVDSVHAFFAALKAADIEIVESEPMQVGDDHYWFQFFDPAGNLLEAAGGT